MNNALNILNKFKFSVLSRITGVKSSEIESALTSKVAHQLYLRIVNNIGHELVKYGFRKQGSINFIRTLGACYQKINFQKSAYGPTMTANIAYQEPIVNDAETLKHRLPNCKRLGELDSGFDKWYPISRNYENTTTLLLKIINRKVIPYLDKI